MFVVLFVALVRMPLSHPHMVFGNTFSFKLSYSLPSILSIRGSLFAPLTMIILRDNIERKWAGISPFSSYFIEACEHDNDIYNKELKQKRVRIFYNIQFYKIIISNDLVLD